MTADAGRLTGELLRPGEGGVHVIGSNHPLVNTLKTRTLPAGLSIAEIVAIAVPDEAAWPHLLVSIEANPIPRQHWHRVRPKPGQTVVFRAVAGKGLFNFAILIASLFLAPILGPGLGALIGVGARIGTAIVGAAITIGGQLIGEALFPVRPPQLANGSGDVFRSLPSIQGARNQARPFDPVPIILGQHRISPYLAARPYTELVGSDQYLRMLFAVGYGPLALRDFKIGETPIGNFQGVSIEARSGLASESAITLYPAQVFEDEFEIELHSAASWQSRTTHDDCDHISGDVTAPNGIYTFNKQTGGFDPYTVQVEVQARIAGSGSAFSGVATLTFTRSKQTLRRGFSVAVPRGKWEVRVRKATADYAGDDQVADTVVWTALRSITGNPPINFPEQLAKVGLRIKATDQLNGVVDEFNLIATSQAPAFNGSTWAVAPTRRPPDLFRYLLQGPFLAPHKRVPDSGIDLENLQEWWTYCVANDFTCDLVITERGALIDRLSDVAATGRASVSFRNGKWGVIWSQASDPVVWAFTPRNSWGFTSERKNVVYPHALRCKYIDATQGYAVTERIVYDDGYDKTNATIFEAAEFPGVTSSALIYQHARTQIAQARLRPETMRRMADVEALAVNRGDRVYWCADTALLGIATGRVKAVDGQQLTLDTRLILETGKSYEIRFWLGDGTSLLRPVVNTAIETDVIVLAGAGDVPSPTNLFMFGEVGRAAPVMRVISVEPQEDERGLVARIVVQDDAPGILTAASGPIPPYDPGTTAPPDPFTLRPTGLIIRERIDGFGITAKSAVELSAQVPRLGVISAFEFQARDVDAEGAYEPVGVAAAPHLKVDVYGIEAGKWQFRVRSQFSDSNRPSDWTESEVTDIAALMAVPDDVDGLTISTLAGVTTLSWNAVKSPLLSHYVIKYAKSVEGFVTWGGSVPIVLHQDGTTAQLPARAGTYLVKAVTFQGVESAEPAVAVSYVSGGTSQNVVETFREDPDFAGDHDGTEAEDNALHLALVDGSYATEGFYVFASDIDLGAVYDGVRLIGILEASGSDISNTMDKWPTLADVALLDNTDPSSWGVGLFYRWTNDALAGSPAWSEWIPFGVADVAGRSFQFATGLNGTATISPLVTELGVTVDMPDRHEGDEHVTCPAGGMDVVYSVPFRAVKTRQVTSADMDGSDQMIITSESVSGFHIEFRNAGGTSISRHFNWYTLGYGVQVP